MLIQSPFDLICMSAVGIHSLNGNQHNLSHNKAGEAAALP